MLERLEKEGFEFDTTTVIHQWNEEHMTVLTYSGVRVDWLKSVLPCLQHVIDSAREETWLDTKLRIVSAESLILMKLISFRQQDLVDIGNLFAAKRGELELEWIRRELATVASADDRRLQRFNELIDEFYLASENAPDQPP